VWHPGVVAAATDLGELTARERDVVLAAADGAGTRAIAGQLFLSPRTVEHHLSAAYRKLGVSNRAALVALLRNSAAEQAPVTRYAVSGDSHIAYQVLGNGPRDLILIPGFVSNVETAWMWPAHARFLRRLAAGRRLIVFDKRGTGLSDPVADPSCLTIEQRMDDVRAVMDAADAHRAALFGFSEGVALGMLFAASYPSRTNGLILYGGLISPALDTAANAVVNVFADPAAAWEIMRQAWGTGQFMAPFLPSAARTKSEMAHVARFERHGASPAAAYAIIRMAASIEVRGLCPAVHAPSLVMHRRDDVLVPPANSRYLAEHLPDVRYVELDGADHPLWVGENERFFDELNRFLSTDHPALSGPPSLLAVLLATDRALDESRVGVIERFRGRPAPGRGGVIYTFDGAVRAVECALALREQQPTLRLTVHAGELRFTGGSVSGPAADIVAKAVNESPAGQVTVTRVVKDLAVGSKLDLTAGPMVCLPGGEQLQLFTARPPGAPGAVGPGHQA
jgi:pimeloyl-ACP methyl ester carboxylesterase/DNA-binding CsgD family transcriptional regulator